MPSQTFPLLRGLEVVGLFYRPPEAKAHALALVGDTHEGALEIEPTNQFDPFAVKVLLKGVHVGYLPKTVSGSIFYLLSASTMASVPCLCLVERKGKDVKIAVGLDLEMGT
jgi:hypothetical protein